MKIDMHCPRSHTLIPNARATLYEHGKWYICVYPGCRHQVPGIITNNMEDGHIEVRYADHLQ